MASEILVPGLQRGSKFKEGLSLYLPLYRPFVGLVGVLSEPEIWVRAAP